MTKQAERETWIVARSFRSQHCWELVMFGDKPDSQTMAQYRQVWPNYRVRMFASDQWEALPYGQQDRDWVVTHNQQHPREADAVRRW